jgi:hypothetical protein
VTCFPFHVLGPAPDRFVVRARFDHSAPLGAEATTTSNTSGASRR